MKKIHIQSLKFHTVYSIILVCLLLVTFLIARDLTLGIVMAFAALYIIGNGIIHGRKNELNRDSILEYILVSAIVIFVFLGVFFTK